MRKQLSLLFPERLKYCRILSGEEVNKVNDNQSKHLKARLGLAGCLSVRITFVVVAESAVKPVYREGDLISGPTCTREDAAQKAFQ